MKDILGYTERMKRSFTEDEKLFFLDKVGDLWRYEAIIDFGCADGTMLHYIDEALLKTAPKDLDVFLRPTLWGIDASERMRDFCIERLHIQFIKNLKLAPTIEHAQLRSNKSPVLLVLSSVLHEIDDETYDSLVGFCETHNVTIAMRDMMFDCGFHENDEVIDRIVDALPTKEQEKLEQIEDRIIYYEEDLPHLISDLRTLVLYEYFMKYTYIENWETESLEWYFNNRIWQFRNRLVGRANNRYKVDYGKKYILPYKLEQVEKDFGYTLRFPTHYQAILKKEQ